MHESELGLASVVAEGDVLADGLLWRGHESQTQQLNELVFYVLNEVQSSLSISLHYEYSQVVLRGLDAGVQHLYDHLRELLIAYSQLLLVLNLVEVHLINSTNLLDQ